MGHPSKEEKHRKKSTWKEKDSHVKSIQRRCREEGCVASNTDFVCNQRKRKEKT